LEFPNFCVLLHQQTNKQKKLYIMADITKCTGEHCESKHTCYRYTAKPNEHYQSMFIGSPIKFGGCEYYINKN